MNNFIENNFKNINNINQIDIFNFNIKKLW